MRVNNKSMLYIAVLLLSLVFAPASYAALQAVAPAGQVATIGGVPIAGLPAWYQDINGVSVQPCLDIVTCGLIGAAEPGVFDGATALIFPSNFPSEAFYFLANNIFQVGAASANVVLGLEFTFVDPVTGALTVPATPGALAAPFQRQRLIITYPAGTPAPTAGNFTITHPWGVTTFPFGSAKCVNNAGGIKCSMTQDLPAPGVPVNFAAALGGGVPGSMSTFLKDPLAPAGFLGNGGPAASFTGAAAGSANSISVTDPLGNTGSTTTLATLVGQLFGMSASPATVVFPAQKPGAISAPTIVTITNPSAVSPATLGPGAVTGANAVDFTLVPGTPVNCIPGAVLPAAGSCTFGVTFSEAAPGVNGAKSALVSFPVTTPLNMPPVNINLAGTIDNIPPTIVSTLPAAGATNWPANNRPHITFSEPVTGVSSTTFTIVGPTGDVGGTITVDATGKLADYAQPADLTTGATYTVTLTAAITDIALNPLAATTFSFKAGAPDTTPPSVSTVTPPNNTTDVQVNSKITAIFAGTVDPNTVNATTFILTEGATGPTVTGSVTFDQANRSAILTPAQDLAFFRTYTATIKGGANGVKSLGQVPMTADFTWTFFTNGAPNPPQLYSPADGATIVGTSVDLQWIKAKDIDGEPVTYQVWYCTNPGMVGCQPVEAPASPSLRDTLAGLGGYGAGILLAGIAIAGGVRSRRKLYFFIALVLISGMAIAACSSNSSDDGGVDPATISTQHVTGLRAGSTYYWKVVADDGNGAQVPSEVRSFTMQ